MRQPPIRRGTARPTPRTVVHLAVADPDLAEDCRAAIAACGLTSQTVELAAPPPGCVVLLVDGRAAAAAGDRATALALSGAGQAIVVASELDPVPVAGREPLCLPRQTAELLRCLERAAGSDSGGRLLVVAGAHGGAGASVLACVLARACAARGETVLVEADPLGGPLELIAGVEAVDGLRLGAVHAGVGELDGEELWQALPREGALAVAARSSVAGLPDGAATEPSQTCGVAVAIARAAMRSGRTVVCDVGRLLGADPALLSAADQVVVAARATVPGLCAATAALSRRAVDVVAIRTHRGDAVGTADIDDWFATIGAVDPETGARARLIHYRSSARMSAAIDAADEVRPPRDMRDLVESIAEAADV